MLKMKKTSKSMTFNIVILLLFAVLSACSKTANIISDGGSGGSTSSPKVNWTAAADSSANGLINNYWNYQGYYFNTNNQGNTKFQYWSQAHALDVLVAAYKRTNDNTYAQYIQKWYNGVKKQNGNTFIGNFYDDMEWNAIAMLRAYQTTNDKKFESAADTVWENIKTGWTSVAGGGVMWSKSTPNSKNACSNGPASILASKLYQINHKSSELEWAKKIYNWEKNTLVDPGTGAVWDHISVSNGNETIAKTWLFTYNQGTFIGAAVKLYNITGNQIYLNDAIKTADYTLNALTTSDRILKDEGSGDGGLFNGIFMRYLTKLILVKNLPSGTRNGYIAFLEHNAKTLWLDGTNKSYVIFGTYWKTKPGDKVDLKTDLSGVILMENAALLNNKGLFKN